MPTKETVEKARRDLAQGKKPSTAAGEFVREEIEHVREGRHGARNTKQAIAIGLSKARRAGVPLPAPGPGQVSAQTRRSAQRDAAAGRRPTRRPSPRRSRATMTALRREGHQSASPRALATQAKRAARKAAATRSRRRARR